MIYGNNTEAAILACERARTGNYGDYEEREDFEMEFKKIKLYEVKDVRLNGDSFSKWVFDEEEAKKEALNQINHCTKSELAKREIYVVGYNIEIPDMYNYEDVDELIDDIMNEEIECPQYECGWFKYDAEFDVELS